MLSHEHGCVAVVGLPRGVDARPRACGHGARHPTRRSRQLSKSARSLPALPTMLAQVAATTRLDCYAPDVVYLSRPRARQRRLVHPLRKRPVEQS